ncbi:MAG: 6-hydroxymethylpterin diphosphokinase MptE-like protein [Chlamydiota bacterium]
MLKALERHIPSARLLLEEKMGAEPDTCLKAADLWRKSAPHSFEFLCVFGLSAPLYALARSWLDENRERRLVFIEEKASVLSSLLEDEDAILLLNDLRVKIYYLESPLQSELIAKKVAWQAVFRKLEIFSLADTSTAAQFQEELKLCHRAAFLLLSEASDWGVSSLRNARVNSQKPSRSGLGLGGKFAGIPAVIVGAGPSLEKNGRFLRELQDRALLLAAGSALNILDIEPHFAASIDAAAPYRQFKLQKSMEIPFCYQNRMNLENFSLVHGEPLLFPDGNSAAIDWIQGETGPFDAGWTVGNFLTQLAVLFGCNPIIFVGMDLCYKKRQKYAHLETETSNGLIEAENWEGKKVWTQGDWLMAGQWTETLARRHPERLFINATEGGLGFKAPILQKSLQSLLKTDLSKQFDLRGKVHAEIQMLSPHTDCRFDLWDASMQRCEQIVADMKKFQMRDLEAEIVYQKLLMPLWQIWKPVFERELDLDLQPLQFSEKMQLNQILFFQQVLQEHLHGE